MRLVFPALIAIFLATPAMAQVSPLQKKDLPELPGKPVSAEIGGEAVVLKGKSLLIAPHQVATVSALKPFLSYELNGKFDYHDQKGRFADLSLRPAVMKAGRCAIRKRSTARVNRSAATPSAAHSASTSTRAGGTARMKPRKARSPTSSAAPVPSSACTFPRSSS